MERGWSLSRISKPLERVSLAQNNGEREKRAGTTGLGGLEQDVDRVKEPQGDSPATRVPVKWGEG